MASKYFWTLKSAIGEMADSWAGKEMSEINLNYIVTPESREVIKRWLDSEHEESPPATDEVVIDWNTSNFLIYEFIMIS